MHDGTHSPSSADTALGNIRRAEVSLNSNVFPAEVSDRARAAVEAARLALRRGDQTAALAASDLAVRLLADALH